MQEEGDEAVWSRASSGVSRNHLEESRYWLGCTERMLILPFNSQRQTAISQFFQLDRLVVEGQKTVSLPFLMVAPTLRSFSLSAKGETDGP